MDTSRDVVVEEGDAAASELRARERTYIKHVLQNISEIIPRGNVHGFHLLFGCSLFSSHATAEVALNEVERLGKDGLLVYAIQYKHSDAPTGNVTPV